MRIDTNTPQSFSSLNGAIKITYTNNISQSENSKSINEAIKLDLSSNEPIIKARNGYINIE
ncbi:hypothetical protein H0A43_02025 [Arcobacter lanthieri]|uniref:hypothetical protein n=1 Tax=Aliarcobacter lanthieri TaxID=1355374 RepID=UPI0019211077|nr:hypothetical protein [Aliarcobacter lanthieri]MBL3519234.1 hypothetical protein [Aliarcobacter lanthieri]